MSVNMLIDLNYKYITLLDKLIKNNIKGIFEH